jgi:LuxR family quorum-sensing system transcriptional regulator SolR
LDSRWQNVRRDFEHLDIAGRTVNFHINNALTKLNAANKTAAAVKAAMLGFL